MRVHDGRAVKSCTVLVGQANGANVTTHRQGIPGGDELHPMTAALYATINGLQCGDCKAGPYVGDRHRQPLGGKLG